MPLQGGGALPIGVFTTDHMKEVYSSGMRSKPVSTPTRCASTYAQLPSKSSNATEIGIFSEYTDLKTY